MGGANLYEYVGSGSTIWIDPYGLFWTPWITIWNGHFKFHVADFTVVGPYVYNVHSSIPCSTITICCLREGDSSYLVDSYKIWAVLSVDAEVDYKVQKRWNVIRIWPFHATSELQFTGTGKTFGGLEIKTEKIGQTFTCLSINQLIAEEMKTRETLELFRREFQEFQNNMSEILDLISENIDFFQKMKEHYDKVKEHDIWI